MGAIAASIPSHGAHRGALLHEYEKAAYGAGRATPPILDICESQPAIRDRRPFGVGALQLPARSTTSPQQPSKGGRSSPASMPPAQPRVVSNTRHFCPIRAYSLGC